MTTQEVGLAVRPPAQRVRTLAEASRSFLRHGSPWLLLTTTVASLAGLVVVGDWRVAQLVVVLVTLAVQPFVEWLLHVYVLHAKPRRVAGRTLDLYLAIRHRAHHANPRDLDLLFIPLRAHLAGAVVVAAGCLALPDAPTRLALAASVSLLSLGYEWLHLLIHTDYKPRTAAYRRLYAGHRLHHYRNENYWFGVSRRFGDTVLRTNPAKDDVPLSPTCLSLLG